MLEIMQKCIYKLPLSSSASSEINTVRAHSPVVDLQWMVHISICMIVTSNWIAESAHGEQDKEDGMA
jgi:hypothetical protein